MSGLLCPPPQLKVWRYKGGVNLMRAKIKKGKIRICVLVHLKNLISLFLAVKVYENVFLEERFLYTQIIPGQDNFIYNLYSNCFQEVLFNSSIFFTQELKILRPLSILQFLSLLIIY